jgi:hypothetical protein
VDGAMMMSQMREDGLVLGIKKPNRMKNGRVCCGEGDVFGFAGLG